MKNPSNQSDDQPCSTSGGESLQLPDGFLGPKGNSLSVSLLFSLAQICSNWFSRDHAKAVVAEKGIAFEGP